MPPSDVEHDRAARVTLRALNAVQDEVAKDYADGSGVGIKGTPMFFINGRVVVGAQSYLVFKKVIDEEVKK